MNIKIYTLSTFFATILLTGCDKENEKLIYESDTNTYISFRTDKLNKELEKTENSLTIPVYRESTKGTAYANIELLFRKNPDGSEVPGREYITTENKKVTFADGENTANIKLLIDLSKLDYLTKAKTQIKLSAGESTGLSSFGKAILTLSLSRKPTWVQMKEKGIYTSQFLGTEKEVIIIKAEEAPFYIIKDCYVANGDIRVDLDNKGNATVEQQKAFRHTEYGIVYVAGTGELNTTANKVVMKLNFLIEKDGQWGILSGIAYEETFTIPSGLENIF
ncbi:hypothetical protein [Bacteroides sp.]|uniref:hypothetical protein n=1 Tax=Bacteroides sp. TaxID=29523 RepID=UPI0025C56BA1|nr:hypothetical protein [Bacteroides sp.]